MSPEDRLDRRLGIDASYIDQMGAKREVPRRTLEALRAALGPRGVDPGNAAAMLAALDRERAATRLEPVSVLVRGRKPMAVPLRPPRGAKGLRWQLTEESGRHHDGEIGLEAGAKALVLPPRLPLGYHRLSLAWSAAGEPTDTATIVVAPRHAYLPPCLRGEGKAWGVAAQLYALRSDRDWGIGDFSGLAAMVGHTAAAGGDAVGTNPLHALFPDQPERCSPYSPSSRLFLNPLYIDVEAVADFAECDAARAQVADAAWQVRREDARSAVLVDHVAVSRLKLPVLELLFASFRVRHLAAGSGRGRDFRAYQAEGGEPLRRFAAFHALREQHGPGWRAWPEAMRDPAAAAVAEFAAAHLPRVEFHEYLQWQAALQLRACADRVAEAGMGIGLYGDLAVGFDPDGADAWSLQALTADGWSIGAPPDALALSGQNWGLPPLNPIGLRADRYRTMRAILRANMRGRGALRIDHVLALQRVFWVPPGTSAAEGAYVRYPFEDLLGLVALESVRNRCLVIGEDLGTVPAGFREAIQSRGVLSYCVLYFERDADGRFHPPQSYPANALATVSTHDLPTLAGFWSGHDVDLREQLGLYPEAALATADRDRRPRERGDLVAALALEKLDAAVAGEVPAEAVHRFLGRTASRLAMVQVEDLLAVADPANVPGTLAEHPNWQRKLPRDVEGIFAAPAVRRILHGLDQERRALAQAGETPRATYRLQMHRGFTFDQATATLPYLQRLGISHLYLSPILEAQPGSTHGYDAVSYERLNPELGGREGYERFSAEMRRLGLKLILDFVPNHMGVGGSGNDWWLELLEWGADAPHAGMFDIDWNPVWPELRGKLLVPLLGEAYGTVLERGELELRFDAEAGSFDVWYHAHRFPIRPRDYGRIAAPASSSCSAGLRRVLNALESCDEPREAGGLKQELARLAADARVREALQAAAAAYGGRTDALHRLLDRQSYRLAWWRSAARRINYRRFFDINQLAGLRMDRRETFDACHRLVGELIERGELHGLRLDHIDGLRDPADYLRELRAWMEQRSGGRGYIVVEKILASHEPIPRDWPIDGTTGYEFANHLNALFVDPRGAAPLRRSYAAFTGDPATFDEVLDRAKAEVIDGLFGAELTSLARRLAVIAMRHWRSREYDEVRLRVVLRDLLIGFPVYRSYVSRRGNGASDRHAVAWAIGRARKLGGDADPAIYDFVRRAALGELAGQDSAYPAADALDFAMRLQQLASPIMAKSLEDTAFYRYGPLLSLNEVGGDPRRFGIGVRAFHGKMRERRRHWPRSMLATSTHDTKRGEDMRARINLLSEMPEEWAERVERWARLNRRAGPAPHPADEHFVYQTLIGAWPMHDADLPRFGERMRAYIVKALREGKRHSSWVAPDLAYEAACADFISRLLATDRRNPFLEDFQPFQAEIARLGVLNSLAQLALKLTVPGVPDTYQGTELWDLSLVDPDNRQPVDFTAREQHLLDPDAALSPGLLQGPQDGRIKLLVIARLLALRGAMPALFAQGTYRPLAAAGPKAAHLVAFQRRHGRQVLVVAAGRLFGGLRGDPQPWRQTRLDGLTKFGAPLRDALTGKAINVKDGAIELADAFATLPVAVLTGEAR